MSGGVVASGGVGGSLLGVSKELTGSVGTQGSPTSTPTSLEVGSKTTAASGAREDGPLSPPATAVMGEGGRSLSISETLEESVTESWSMTFVETVVDVVVWLSSWLNGSEHFWSSASRTRSWLGGGQTVPLSIWVPRSVIVRIPQPPSRLVKGRPWGDTQMMIFVLAGCILFGLGSCLVWFARRGSSSSTSQGGELSSDESVGGPSWRIEGERIPPVREGWGPDGARIVPVLLLGADAEPDLDPNAVEWPSDEAEVVFLGKDHRQRKRDRVQQRLESRDDPGWIGPEWRRFTPEAWVWDGKRGRFCLVGEELEGQAMDPFVEACGRLEGGAFALGEGDSRAGAGRQSVPETGSMPIDEVELCLGAVLCLANGEPDDIEGIVDGSMEVNGGDGGSAASARSDTFEGFAESGGEEIGEACVCLDMERTTGGSVASQKECVVRPCGPSVWGRGGAFEGARPAKPNRRKVRLATVEPC